MHPYSRGRGLSSTIFSYHFYRASVRRAIFHNQMVVTNTHNIDMAFPCVCLPAAVVVLCLNKCVYSHICLSRLQFRAINQWRRQDLKFGGRSHCPPFPSSLLFNSLPASFHVLSHPSPSFLNEKDSSSLIVVPALLADRCYRAFVKKCFHHQVRLSSLKYQ